MTVEDYDLPDLDVVEPRRVDAASRLAQIRAERDALAGAEYLDLPIPTWNGDLVARYQVIERRQAERLQQQFAKAKGGGDSDLDFIIRACVSIWMPDADGTLVRVETDDGRPVRYDGQLAQLLGLDDPQMTARQIVGYLFRENQIAISAHANRVATWMQDTSVEVDGAIRGN